MVPSSVSTSILAARSKNQAGSSYRVDKDHKVDKVHRGQGLKRVHYKGKHSRTTRFQKGLSAKTDCTKFYVTTKNVLHSAATYENEYELNV